MTFNLIAIYPNDPYHVAVIHILGVGDRNRGIGHQYFSITNQHQRISQFAFSGEEGWATVNPVKGFENAVTPATVPSQTPPFAVSLACMLPNLH
ncbi:hypothetical protein Patl1_04931 [Pistacia atlantica]|uniref:Uncharacterized protein n=1 Tax=Pistacia atlantica TaxID=434234 RepID=A0ACC1BV62_9ROSI|nr:hypothetical protein Patl1_04931 [Pistacia atlantica]